MKKCIGYVRVSTKEQSEVDKYGVEAQKQAILNYASEHECEIIAWKVDVVSGISDEKKELNEILYSTVIANPPFEAIICYKSDRISRDMKQYFYCLYVLEKKGVQLISVNEDFDGELANVYRAILLFCAEQERKNITLRTSGGRKIKAKAGGYAGGRCPFGYDSVDGKLVINIEEAEIVKLVFHLRFDLNKSYNEIAKTLGTQGFIGKSGGKIYASTVFAIIQNKHFYEGYIKYGDGKWIKGVHEPIIQEGLYLVPNDA